MISSEGDFGVVAIVGVGLIGGSLGMALRRRRLCSNVVGVGRSSERLQKAVALGAIDVYSTDLAESIAEADVIVLCTPVSRIIEDLPLVIASAGSHAVITDVGSVKTAIVDASQKHPCFVGSHPMAGSEMTGVEAARETLFQEATWAVTPHSGNTAQTTDRIVSLARSVGSYVHVMAPEVHDAAVAVTSHLPHVMAAAFMRLAAARSHENPALSVMTAGSFADATRVAASSAVLWSDICLTNRKAVLEAIELFGAQLELARSLIEAKDADGLHRFFSESALAKREWPRQ